MVYTTDPVYSVVMVENGSNMRAFRLAHLTLLLTVPTWLTNMSSNRCRTKAKGSILLRMGGDL